MNDKYLQYNLNDFLEDPAFIEEIRQGHPNKEAWESWLRSHSDEKAGYLEAMDIIQKLTFKEEQMSSQTKQLIWDQIERKTSAPLIPSGKHFLRFISMSGAAAAVALMVFYLMGMLQQKTISTVAREHISYTLPDASKVDLNAASMISFDKKSWQEERKLSLSGEAFFQVEKGTSFVVESNLGQVKVLGTRFNVFSRDSLFKVHCQHGSVQVISMYSDTIILNAGEGVSYLTSAQKKNTYKINPDKINAWLSGVFNYNESSLDIIFEEMERQFDIAITFEEGLDLQNMKYTGSFQNKDLEEALHHVCWPMNLEYQMKGKFVYISLRQ